MTKKIAIRRYKLKIPKRRNEAINTTGVKVFRGGVTATKWKLVAQKPKIRKQNDSVSIRANIAVNKSAERQSEMMIEISSEALMDIFESHFELQEKGLRELVLSRRKARRAASTLMEVIDDIRGNWFGIVGYRLNEVPLESDLFEDPRSLKQLELAQAHDWEK